MNARLAFVLALAFWACTAHLLAEDEKNELAVEHVLFGSCIQQDHPIPIFHTMLRHNPQLLIFLGDNIYADTEDMVVMRNKYERLAKNPDFKALRDACPQHLATWDDHDFGVNDGGSEYSARRESEKLFLDFWQVSSDSPRRNREGIYDANLFGPPGKRLQVILLDTRFFRSPWKQGERRVGGPYLPDEDSSKTILGEAQWHWLEQQLRQPAEVRIVVSSIQFAASDAGQETWSNLPRERQRFIDLITRTKAGGVLIVSGDRHWSELSAIKSAGPYPLYDLTSSSFNQVHPRGTPTENSFRDIDATYHRENFGVVHIDWNQPDPLIRLEIRDREDAVRIEKQIRLSDLQPADLRRP